MARLWARSWCFSSAVVWIRRKSCVVSWSFIRCWLQSPLQMLGKTSPTLTQHSHLVRLSYSSTLLFSTKIICFWRCTTCENEKWNNLLYFLQVPLSTLLMIHDSNYRGNDWLRETLHKFATLQTATLVQISMLCCM